MNEGIVVLEEDRQKVAEAEQFSNKLSAFVITNNEEYKEAGEYLVDLRKRIKVLKERFKERTKPFDLALKGLKDFFKAPISKMEEVDLRVSRALRKFNEEEEAKRKAEEEKLRKLQEKEALKLEKKAEKLEAKGNVLGAEQLKEQADELVSFSPIVESKVEKVEGLSFKTNWKFRITNANLIPREYMIPDEVKIGKVVRALKADTCIPGVTPYPEANPNVRG